MRRSTHLLVSILLVFLMVSCKNKQSKQSTTNQQSQKEVVMLRLLLGYFHDGKLVLLFTYESDLGDGLLALLF